MSRKLLYSPLFLVLTLTLVNVVGAVEGDDINLQTFDDALAERFGISVWSGGLLATSIMLVMFMLPVAVFSKSLLAPLFVGIPVTAFCVGVGWLDTWLFFLIPLIIAILYGMKIKDVVVGEVRG